MQEIYKDSSLPFIQVSNFGGLYKLSKHVTYISCKGELCEKFVKGSIIKAYDNGTGYLQVKTMVNGITHRKYLHVLVWEAFNGEVPVGFEIDHLDNNKTNNRLDNLRLITRKDNMHKMFEHNPHVYNNLVQYKVNNRKDSGSLPVGTTKNKGR